MNTLRSLRTVLAALVLGSLCATAAHAQTNVAPEHKFCWGENVGFMNFRDASSGAQGVRIASQHLSGFAWAENAGWINFGDGSPASPPHYANTSGADFGVNIAPNNDLFGLAWGENLGWINFDTRTSLTPFAQQARVVRTGSTGRLRGYAWGENIGWVNLDHAEVHVAFEPLCAADFNGDSTVNATDIFIFLDAWFAQNGQMGPELAADVNGSGTVDATDIFIFLDSWFAENGQICT